MKNLRYDFIITFIVGSFIMLSAMWPALLATLLLFTAIVILKDACGEGGANILPQKQYYFSLRFA